MTFILEDDQASREYVLERLDREHVRVLANEVKARLALGRSFEACYMPGDATHYALLFVPLHSNVVGAPGGGTEGWPPSSRVQGEFFVWYEQRGTGVTVQQLGDLEWAALKLTYNQASALAIWVLLAAVLA